MYEWRRPASPAAMMMLPVLHAVEHYLLNLKSCPNSRSSVFVLSIKILSSLPAKKIVHHINPPHADENYVNNNSIMDMEEYDLVPAAAIDDEAAVIVSETDAADVHSNSSSSAAAASSGDEADLGEGEERGGDGGERSSSWLSSSSTQMQHWRHPHYESDDDDDFGDAVDDSDGMKNESTAASSYNDDLYCKNMDDEDEAWVYEHMRGGGGGREDLINARHPCPLRNFQQENNNFGNSTEQYEHHHHAKKAKGIDDNSMPHDTDGAWSAAFESESNNDNPMDSDNEQYQHQQQYDEQHQSNPLSTPQMQQHLRQPQASPTSTMSLVKPRSSDAILSCPSCFNIVCMDCQQHEKYANQYRAMFVMNIGVDWNRKMVYDDAMGCLKLLNGGSSSSFCEVANSAIAGGVEHHGGGDNIMVESNNEGSVHMQLGEEANPGVDGGANVHRPDKIPEEYHETSPSSNKSMKEDTENESEAFYSVHCSYCRYEVAALDMKDEIYYFFGCIASS